MPTPKKKKILIIEDAVFVRNILSYFIQQLGYDILVADDSDTGIDVAKNTPPDLIFCDYNLPTKKGNEVISTLGVDKKTQRIPIVIVSGVGHKINKDHFGSDMVKEIITKPFSMHQIQTVIEKYLG